MRKLACFCIVVALLLGSLAFKRAEKVEKGEHSTWAGYGGGPENIHYSTLKQINRGIFSRDAYVKSWSCHTGESMSKVFKTQTGVAMIGAA